MTRITNREAARLLHNLLSTPPKPKRPRHKPATTTTPAPRKRSAGEAAFVAALALHGLDLGAPDEEHIFAPPRRWRFDFAWVAARVAVEIDGGQWKAGGGRHNTDEDRTKLNRAAALGWRVLRFSPAQVKADPIGCVQVVRDALGVLP